MVFHSVSETETPPVPLPPAPKPSMASTFPAKSQPLHNFPLNLKWSMNQSNAQRFRRMPDQTHLENRPVSPLNDDRRLQRPELPRPSSYSPVKSDHRSVKLPYPTENSSGSGNSARQEPVWDGGKSGFTAPASAAAAAAEHVMAKEEKWGATSSIESPEKKLAATAPGVEKWKGSEGKSKIFIRFPGKNKGAVYATDAGDEALFVIEDDEPMPKTWNLRPRKAVTKPPNANGGAPRNAGAPVQVSKPPAPSQPPVAPEEKAAPKRQRFSVSLSKEEIEEDFLRMTGSKPPKKPKKRSRIVQKQLDGIFPGLWLGSVNPDLYRVPDPPLKA